MPLKTMAVTDISDMTEAELDFEEREEERPSTAGEEVEREGAGGGSRCGSSSTRSSSTRPSSSDSLKTSSGQTDQSADEGRGSDGKKKKDKPKRKLSQSAVWQSFKKAGVELNEDTRKAIRYIGRKIRNRHEPRQTKVKEIHILPGEDDDQMWARRVAGGSAQSCSSSGSDPVS